MSTKRKRHQHAEASTKTDERTPAVPEIVSYETEQIVHGKILSPDEADLVQKKVFYTLKEMGRAFKKARDFEVRKIIKRIKIAKYFCTST